MKKLIYNVNGFFYEKTPRTGEVRELRPTFANLCWKVYTIFSPEGINYKIVGVNRDGEQREYTQYGGLSRSIVYYEPAGRDLIYHDVTAPDWHLLSLRNGKLCDITPQLVNNREKMPLMVTLMEFQMPFLHVHVKAVSVPCFYENDYWFRQVEDGYELVSDETAAELRKGFF